MKTIKNTKIIGIDHGYGNMKTANCCFKTGISAYDSEPLFTADMQMDRLTAPLLQELIDRIDVYEVTGTGKNRKQQIKIHYKFVGYLELPSLARQNNYREETRKGVAVEYVPNALPA